MEKNRFLLILLKITLFLITSHNFKSYSKCNTHTHKRKESDTLKSNVEQKPWNVNRKLKNFQFHSLWPKVRGIPLYFVHFWPQVRDILLYFLHFWHSSECCQKLPFGVKDRSIYFMQAIAPGNLIANQPNRKELDEQITINKSISIIW